MADTDNAPIGTAGDTDVNDNIDVNNAPLDNKSASDTPGTPPNQVTPEQAATQNPFPGNTQVQPGQAPIQSPQPPKTLAEARGPMNGPPTEADGSIDWSTHPAVQRADLLHSIAQSLAGGPRFTTTIDPNTGYAKRTPVPLSRGDIGMALAAEAIQGSLAGLGVKPGPGNLGRAAQAGGQAVAQSRQQVDQTQNENAQADFARHAQVFETNMRLHQNALSVGRQNFDTNEKYVGQFAPLADQLIKDHPEVVKGIVNESDLSKYHITKDSALPYKTVPRLNPTTGEQVTNSYGEPQWDTQYLIVDPSFKSGDLLSDDDKAEAVKFNLPGFVDSNGKASELPQSLPMRLSMATGIKSKIASLRLSEQNINDFYSTLNKHNTGSSQSIFSIYPKSEDLADFITKTESGGKADARNIRNNNPGNLVADSSWRGKVDNTNLPKGQTPFRVYDTPEEGRQALVNQINLDRSRKPNQTPEDFFQKYDSQDAPAYAQAARQDAGVQAPADNATPHPPVDLVDAVKNDPTLPNALEKFQPLLNAANGNYEKAIGALGQKDPQAAGKILQLYGGSDNIHQYDQNRTNADTVAKNAAEAPGKVALAGAEATAREKAKTEADDAANKVIEAQYKDEVPTNNVRVNYLSALDPGRAATIKAVGEGRDDPNTLLRGKEGKAFADQLHFAYPAYDRARFPTYQKTREDFTSGPASKDLTSFNTAIHHLNVMLQNAHGIGAVPVLGAVARATGDLTETGQQAVRFENAKTALIDELGKAYKGSALTEQDKKSWSDRIKTWSPAEARANAPSFLELLDGKLNGLENNWRNAAPPGAVSPINIMSPEAKQVFTSVLGREPMTQVDDGNGNVIAGKNTGTTSAPNQTQVKPAYAYTTKDGKQGWDGKQWVVIPAQQ